MIGTSLSHYRITEKLGQGGMGEVYRAEDANLLRGTSTFTAHLSLLTSARTQDQELAGAVREPLDEREAG